MPETALLLARWIAIFGLVTSIALIIVRWRFPRKQEPSRGAPTRRREVWRHWQDSRSRHRERRADARALRGRSVLVINPSERGRRVLIWQLENLGCRVSNARTGIRGLELASSAKPDVIIADALLPDLPAADLYRAARLPVVFFGVLKARRKNLANLGDNVACLGRLRDPEDAVCAAGRLLRRESSVPRESRTP